MNVATVEYNGWIVRLDKAGERSLFCCHCERPVPGLLEHPSGAVACPRCFGKKKK